VQPIRCVAVTGAARGIALAGTCSSSTEVAKVEEYVEWWRNIVNSTQTEVESGPNDVALAAIDVLNGCVYGPDGLARARELQPEVVFCDIGLPGMDGYEVARALRADDSLRGTLLVALSGYAMPEDLMRAKEAGFGRHLAKPAGPNQIEELLGLAPGIDPLDRDENAEAAG
jgi:CheY-like chemotaxis protein